MLVACCTEECVCWWRVALRSVCAGGVLHCKQCYAAYIKEIITSIAPEDGRISPKHVELSK